MLRIHEIFNLHLLKFSATEDEVARCNFITKRLTLLSDTKWQIRIETIDNVFEIGEDALSGFGAEIRDTVLTLSRANVRFEHHIKRPRFTQWITIRAFDALFYNRCVHLLHSHTVCVNAIIFEDMIGAVAAVINCIFT